MGWESTPVFYASVFFCLCAWVPFSLIAFSFDFVIWVFWAFVFFVFGFFFVDVLASFISFYFSSFSVFLLSLCFVLFF